MKVREVMSPLPGCVGPSDTLLTAARKMRLHSVDLLPVCDGAALVGVITERDVTAKCVGAGASPIDCLVEDYMSREPICVGPDEDLDLAMKLMGQEQVRQLCVMDDGCLVGIVAISDIVMLALRVSPVSQGPY